ncbi:MAG: transcription termination/antitermination protein NusA [Ruminococcaceae bacterium]|nr:transcription termination/antitermination protein NusA [Oscillospiraceae bacterium]
MANINELQIALDLLEKEKGIDKEYMLDALKTALIHAYKRNYKDECENIEINISDSGNVKVIASKIVVEDFDEQFGPDDNQILLNDAKEYKAKAKIGDTIKIEIAPKDFGRIAAQTGKQIILQKLREAERERILEEFSIKSSDIITATVRRFEKVVPRPTDDKPAKPQPVKINVILDIGKAEATMTSREQVKGENYTINDKLKVLVLDVRNSPRGPHILVSRAHADLVRRLFEREVPEIADGILEIKSVAREAGVRSKIAVFSNDPNVDPVGSCVGNRGSRVNAVVEELWGEKVDIVKYSDDPTEYLTAAISPAKVSKVIVSEEWETLGKKEATVVVDDSQLSLAIGKEGLNARLAAKLTGWKIDIKSTSQYEVSD